MQQADKTYFLMLKVIQPIFKSKIKRVHNVNKDNLHVRRALSASINKIHNLIKKHFEPQFDEREIETSDTSLNSLASSVAKNPTIDFIYCENYVYEGNVKYFTTPVAARSPFVR